MSRAVALLIFDGDCGFCTSAARWAEGRHRNQERSVASQRLSDDELESFGLTRRQVASAAWWVDADGRTERGHRAVGRGLQACGGLASVVGWLALAPPTSWLAAGLYAIAVRWRHRLPGGTPACHPDGPGATVAR